jgi:succinate dehydrogenase hydrophobic anchor subunit
MLAEKRSALEEEQVWFVLTTHVEIICHTHRNVFSFFFFLFFFLVQLHLTVGLKKLLDTQQSVQVRNKQYLIVIKIDSIFISSRCKWNWLPRMPN